MIVRLRRARPIGGRVFLMPAPPRALLGEIVNVLADEKVLDEKGKVDPKKLNAFPFDPSRSGYYAIGEKVGQAWSTGVNLLKK